jgi:hypothetical protein
MQSVTKAALHFHRAAWAVNPAPPEPDTLMMMATN